MFFVFMKAILGVLSKTDNKFLTKKVQSHRASTQWSRFWGSMLSHLTLFPQWEKSGGKENFRLRSYSASFPVKSC